MATAYERILASRKKFEEQAGLTEQQYEAARQYALQHSDGQALYDEVERTRQMISQPSADITTQHKNLNAYTQALRKLDTFMGQGGQVAGVNTGYLQSLQEQYNQSWDVLKKQIQNNQMAYQIPGLAQQAEQLSRERGMEITPARLMGQMGLVDANGNLTEAGQKYWQRGIYRNIQTESGQEAARWGQQNQADMDELETVQYWQDIVRNLPQTSDSRVMASNQEWLRQAAEATGITSYTDAADLSAQLAARESQLRAKSGWSERMANRNAGRQQMARAYEYQLDNPDESIEANYYLALRDEAGRDARTVDGFMDFMQTPQEAKNWLRYNSAYANQLYQDQKNEDILAIRSDPTVGAIYQETMEASRATGEVATLRAQAHGEMQDYGGISAQTEAAIRELAQQYGITVGQGDDALEAALEQIHQQQSHTVNTNMARLQAQGYDPEKLRQYIQQALNEERMDAQNAEARQYASEHPGAASVGTGFTNLMSGGAYIATAPQAFGNMVAGLTGNYDSYVPIDPNNPAFDQAQYVMAVRDEVSQNLAEKYPNGEFMGQNTASFLYGTGMSMLDNMVQMAVGAAIFGPAAAAGTGGARAAIQAGVQAATPATLATMGLSAAAQQLTTLTEHGVPSDQAYLLATLNGGVEIITEKIGIDALVSSLGRKEAAQILRVIFQQMAAEGAEEGLAEIGNLAADYIVRMDDSEIMQMIDAGRRQGMTEEQAKQAASKTFAQQLVSAVAAGAISGFGFGAMSSAGIAADAVSPASAGARIRAEGNEEALGTLATAFGVEYSPDMSDRQIGKTYRAVQKAGAQMQRDMQYGMSMASYAKEKGYDSSTTKALERSWDAYHSVYGNDMSSREFAATWNSVKTAGQVNMAFDTAVAELGETKLSMRTLENAYKAGQRLYNLEQKAAKKQTKAAPAVIEQANETAVELVSENVESMPAQTELVERDSESAAQHAQQLMSERINVNALSDEAVEAFFSESDSDISTERQGALAMARMLTGVSKNISQVVFVDSANYDAEGHVRTLNNGMWDPTNRTMTIDINAGRLNVEQQMTFMTRAMSHELTHSIKTSAPSQYAELERFVLREMDKQRNLENLIRAKVADYAKEGIELDRQGAIDELVAEACEQMLERTDVLNKLAQENKSLWEKIRDYIKSVIAKLKALYKNLSPNSTEAKMMQGVINDLQAKWDAAFKASLTAENEKNSGQTQHMVAGRWAAYADSGQLARAEEMENKGANALKILKETGWYRGADGQWRFEIDDSVMRYKRPLPSLLKRTNGQVLLKDILYHPDLFANYPFLNKVKVIFMQMPEGQRGSYNPYTATVKLNVSLLHGPEATLLHELQHAIQEFEGFAGGAYQGYWRKKKLTGYIETMKVRELENKIMEFSMDPKTRDAAAMWHRMQEVKEDPNALKELKKEAARDGLTMKIAKFQSLQDQRAKAAAEFVDRDSYDLYRNTAGEVEARTTAERQYMTESERRNNLHFVGDKNTVFADVFGEPMELVKAHPKTQYQVNAHTEMDRVYAEALNSGNMDAAQRLVEQAAATAGYWRSRWHETKPESDFHVFNINRADNASADNQTPYGIFTKAHDRTVGLGGKQMRLFVRADRILRFRDRDTMKQQMPEEYKALLRRLEEVDAKYGAEAEEMEDQFFWDIEEWLEAQPNEDELRKRIDPAKPFYESIGDAMPQELIDLETRMTLHSEEWHEAENVEILAAKEWLTKWLPANGYDAMELEYDNGAGDRVTDALIVLSEDQVKLADVITRDDSGNIIPLSERFKAGNKDIRYQVSRDTASTMDLLMGASMDGLSKAEADHLLRYRDRVNEIRQNQQKIEELKAEELTADINAQIHRLESQNSMIYRKVASAEKSDMMQRIAERERAAGDIEVQRMDNRVADLEDEIDELEQKIRNAKLAGQMGQGRRDAANLRKTEERLTKRNEKQKQTATDKAAKQKQQAAERLDAQKQKYTDKLKEQRTQAKQAAADARLAGQMGQGRRDAVALQRTVEEYEARLESKRRELRIARESRDKRIAQMQESRIKSMDSRHRTQMRHKIRKVVKELDALLLRGTKDRNIRDEMKAAVASALEAINMDSGDYEGRIAKLDEAIAAATDPVVIATLTESRERIAEQGSNMRARLSEMKTAYSNFSKDTSGNYNSTYDEVVQSYIDATIKKVGSTPLWDMTVEQLDSVYNMYKMILTDIQQANKLVRDEKNRTIYSMGNSVIRELDHKKRHPLHTDLGDFAKKFGWNNLKPVYAFETIGSNTLMELYENVRGGEDTWARDVYDAREFYRERAEKYNLSKWDTKTRHKFYSRSGKEFALDVNQIMSLYAYSKRSQADEHLQRGGFVFDSAIEVVEKKKGVPIKYKVNTKQAYGIDPLTLNDIIATLTDEQRNFVDEMQAYLSDTMGEKGNEVSLDMYGVRLFNEQNYFPLKTSNQFMFEQNEVAGEVKLKNSGFSKHTTPHASNPVILSNFMDVWGRHVNDMSMYHAFVIPLENFNRVYNYQTLTTDEAEPDSVKGTLADIYGDAPVNYIKQLLVDLNGGARSDPTASVIDWGLSKFKSAAVMASASVVIQQPTAIIRAAAYIDPIYLGAANKQWHKNAWEELKRYAPVAIIKEMGRFDTNMGRSTADWIIAEDYTGIGKVGGFFKDSEYRSDVFSRPASFADEFGWLRIWAAVKTETAKKTDLKPGTQEFLEYCGKRFTYIIERTQVYDSVLSRSAMMRSKDTGMKMATAFMAEPTTTMNMLVHAVQQMRRGYAGAAARTATAVVSSLILNSILVSLVYAARDDDEDETYTEKYFQALAERLKSNVLDVVLLNSTPFFRDIVSVFQGYDVERTDMSIVGDIREAVMAWKSEDKSLYEKVSMTAEQVLRFFGIPLKNIRRDTEALINVVRTAMGEGIWTEGDWRGDVQEGWQEGWTGKDISSGQKLYEAYTTDDAAEILRLEGEYQELYGEDWYKEIQSELRSYAKKLYLDGDLSYDDTADFLIEYAIELSNSIERQHDTGTITDEEYLTMLENEAYWTIKGWDSKAEDSDASTSKYADLNAAIIVGGDITAATEELLEHGVTQEDIDSAASTQIREMYRNGDIDRETAEEYLAEYANLTDSKKLYTWFTESDHWMETGESDFGAYGPVWDEILNGGDVNGAIDAMVEAGWTEEAVEENVRKKTREWVLGTSSDGYTISTTEARSIISKYGGVDDEDLDGYVNAYEFWLDNPDHVEDFDVNQANKYLEYGTGIGIDMFLEFREATSVMDGEQDASGKTINGSKKAEIMAYIDAMPISNAQKDQLYYAAGYKQTTIYEAPWH